MAIHIDIIAHLRQRELIMEGEKLKRLADSLTRDTNRIFEKGVSGRNAQTVRSNNRVLRSYNQTIVSIDGAIKARNREIEAIQALNDAADEYVEIEKKLSRARSPKTREQWTKALETQARKVISLEKAVESATYARARAEMAAAASSRDLKANQLTRVEASDKLRKADAEAAKELRKLTSVQDRAKVALRDHAAGLSKNESLLRQEIATNQRAIDSNRRLSSGFDRASESVIRYRENHKKLIEMMGNPKTSSSSLESQVNQTGRAYRTMDRDVRHATQSLREHLIEEAKLATRSPFGRGGRRLPDIEGAMARNLGALTPLGTVTPGLLIPLGAGFFAVAQGAVAASQSVMLLPAALSAAGAGLGVMQMATLGVSDALTAMMDYNNPDKFAESLRMLSPAAQQFALSIQQLLPTFRELKNAVQDTFFAGMPQLINGLTKTYRDAFGGMAVEVADAFNGIFMEIGKVLQDPRARQSVSVMFDGIIKTFQALIPLAGSLTQVFVQMSAVGAQVLPGIVDDLATLMSRFAAFIDKAAASGDLAKWMREGWEAVKALGSVIGYAGKMLYDVFGLHGPEDIQRFKTTLFGVIDGFGVFFGTLEKFFHGLVVVLREIAESPVGRVLGFIIDKIGGLENALAVLAGAGVAIKLGLSFYKLYKFIGDGIAYALMKIGLLRAGMAGLPAAGAAAGSAAGAATAAGVAAGGAAAGAGFAAKLKTVLKGAGWVGIGMAIADAIGQGMGDGKGGWRDALAAGLDPGKFLNPEYWLDKGFETPAEKREKAKKSAEAAGGSPPSASPWGEGSVVGSDGKPYQPVQPGTPGAVPIPGKNQWGLPGTPGSSPSGGREPDKPWSSIPDLPFGGFDVPVPNPGGGPTPNVPYSQYSLQNIPLGQFGSARWTPPDPRSLMSQLTPYQMSQKGYGYVVDPQGVFDAESQVTRQRAAVEEARARVLELAQDNQATEQQKVAAQANIVEAERSLLKSQVELLEAQRGTWKKINESIGDQTKMLDGLGAEIDADFGISKGLPGIAENLTKFLANLVAAPVYGALAGVRGAGGDLGGAKGLFGAAALSGAFGPQYMQPQPSADSLMAPGAQVMAPGAQIIVPGGSISGDAAAGIPGTPGTGTGGTGAGGPGLYPSPGQGMPMRWNLPPLTGAGYPGDAAILAQIPKGGRYDSVVKDLSKGLVDCASGVEDLVNIIDGKSTVGGSLTTHNAASLLPGMGFQRGMGGPGDFRIGYNSGHMEATLPGGTPVNFGSTASVASGGVAGAGGAYSPGFTDFWYRPMTGPDGGPGAGAGGRQRYPSPGQGMPMPWTLPPLTPGGGAGVGGPGPVTPGGGGYAPLSPSELTNPALTNPTPLGGGGLPLAPPGYTAPGVGPSQIGAVVAPPEGTGSGFGGFSGGILGAVQGAIGAAAGAAGAAGGMGAGGPAAAALAQIGIEELNRAIAFAGQATGIGISGLMETFLPTGGSDLANNNWFTRLVGGVVGMRPLLPNFANVSGAAEGVQQNQHLGNNPQGTPGPGNVNVTQNNYNQNGNSATSDLERLATRAVAAPLPAMGAGR